MDLMEVADPDAVHAVRTFIRKQLARELKAEFLSTVCLLLWSHLELLNEIYVILPCIYFFSNLLQVKNNRSSQEYVFNHSEMARRALKNISLGIPYHSHKHTFTFSVVAVHH